MNTNELRQKSVEELKGMITGLLKTMFNLRMQRGLGEMPRPHQFKEVRREIARIKTILREKVSENE